MGSERSSHSSADQPKKTPKPQMSGKKQCQTKRDVAVARALEPSGDIPEKLTQIPLQSPVVPERQQTSQRRSTKRSRSLSESGMAEPHLYPMAQSQLPDPCWKLPPPSTRRARLHPQDTSSPEQRMLQQELYAGNLPSNISMKHLKSLFSKYKPKRIQKVENKKKCYAFIDFEDPEMLELAIKQLNNTMYEGRRLVVHRAHRNRKERISWKSIKPEQSDDICKDSEEPSDVISFTCDMCAALERSSLCANSEYLPCEENEKSVCEILDQGGQVTHKQTQRVTQDQDMCLTHKQNACTMQDQSVCMMAVLHQQSRNLDLEEKKLLLEIKKLQLEIRKLAKENLVCKCI